MFSPVALEICVDSVESALASERGGADRVELCGNLLEGGTTPGAGMIATVRRKISIGLQVMVRPRGGDFCYSPDEFETMKEDILAAKQLGADGVALGLLRMDGSVDKERTRQLAGLARPLRVTYHRAFDMSADLFQALQDAIESGVDRILTSGGQPAATEALDTLAQLVQAASGRITIMACGGIRAGNAQRVVERTRVREIHAGPHDPVPSPMRYRNEKISMGTAVEREYQRFVVLEESVKSLKASLGKFEI